MPKSKMKERGLSEIGGRIRKARNDSFLSIKELAEKIGVSFAYLGMVERSERNPSDKMLSAIADATDVSINWLKYGNDSQDADSNDAGRVDVSLFLNIILHEATDINAEVLSMLLNIDKDELERVLGKTDNYDPLLYAECSTVAKRVDIPKLLGKLYEIEAFLKQTEVQKIDRKIIVELRTVLSEVFQDKVEFYHQDSWKIARSMSCLNIWSPLGDFSEPTRDFTFQQESTGKLCRVMLYVPLIGRQAASRLQDIISNALDFHDNSLDFDSIVLVFSDEDSFEKSKAIIEDQTPIRTRWLLKKVVVMLIDTSSLRITKKEKICLRQTKR